MGCCEHEAQVEYRVIRGDSGGCCEEPATMAEHGSTCCGHDWSASRFGGPHHESGECCGGHGFRRRFETRAERRAVLEAYLAELRAEAQAVEERLAELAG